MNINNFRSYKMGNIYQATLLSQKEREIYCREKRYERFENGTEKINHLKLREKNFKIIQKFLKTVRILGKENLVILNECKNTYDKPVIFCPTHIGADDILITFEAIKQQAWLLFGDPKELYKNIFGFLADINGMVPFDYNQKKDRAAAKAYMGKLLMSGCNLLIFPEGDWNLSHNKLVAYLYIGAVELAIKHNAYIVPVALCREDTTNTYYVSFGKEIDYSNATIQEKFLLNGELRDSMATLKWEIMEKLPILKREDITHDFAEKFYNGFLTDVVSSNLEDAEEHMFHPQNTIDYKDAFDFMDKLIISKNNAFLLNKRIV